MNKQEMINLLSDQPKSVKSFMGDALDNLISWGVDVQIHNDPLVYTVDQEKKIGLGCSGFFEDRPGVRLGLAIGKPLDEWISIFVHEYAHATQWHDQDQVWTNLFDDWGRGVEEASSALDGWLQEDLEWDEATIWDVVDRARSVELDCERRALQLMEKYNLPIDRKDYAQKAAAYVYFYNHLAQTRQWYPEGQAPYQVEEVWSHAPQQLSSNPQTPPELEAAFVSVYGRGALPKRNRHP